MDGDSRSEQFQVVGCDDEPSGHLGGVEPPLRSARTFSEKKILRECVCYNLREKIQK